MSAVIAEVAPVDVPVKTGRKKKLLILALAVVLLLALAGGGGVWFMKKRAADKAAAEAAEDEGHAGAEAGHKADARAGPPTYLPLDPFVVNLADRDADRYAQIGITLELENALFADQVKAWMPSVRNAILMVLAGKTARELLDRSGKEMLAQEILREAVVPMGIVAMAPKPVTTAAPAPADAHDGHEPATAAASGAGSGAVAAKKERKAPATPNPIRNVHFSSFIIQ